MACITEHSKVNAISEHNDDTHDCIRIAITVRRNSKSHIIVSQLHGFPISLCCIYKVFVTGNFELGQQVQQTLDHLPSNNEYYTHFIDT